MKPVAAYQVPFCNTLFPSDQIARFPQHRISFAEGVLVDLKPLLARARSFKAHFAFARSLFLSTFKYSRLVSCC